MDIRHEVQQFLTAARGRITPQQAGIIASTGMRRVPGLRREEVAELADVSIAYYTRIERGDLRGVSDSVLAALSRALQLDEAERSHLRDLARGGSAAPAAVRAVVPERVHQLLTAMQEVPVIATDRLRRPVASNALGRALFPHLFPAEGPSPSTLEYTLLDPRARHFYPDWEDVARGAVSNLRFTAGQHPGDEDLTSLIDRLATQSDHFRCWWTAQTVRRHTQGVKRIHHPKIGPLTVTYEVLTVPSAPGISLAAYLTAPGTPDADALELLRQGIPTGTPTSREGLLPSGT